MMSQWPMDRASAQRWFAVEFNNEGWSLVESAPRSSDEIERLLHLAHAAFLHWSTIGASLNRQRGLDLLARAYVAAGRGEQALHYAEQAWQLSLDHGDQQTPFDRAEAMGTMSVALRAAGRTPEADEWRSNAQAAAAQLDNDDREVIERLLRL
jgi:hypothetical protein